MLHWDDKIRVKPLALALGADDATLTESTLHGRIERLFEKGFGRANGVRAINDDDVIGIFVVLEPNCAISMHRVHSWVQ